MKTSTIINVLAMSVAASAGPLETLFAACKIECLPAFSSVSACLHNIEGQYTATFTPADMSVTVSGNGTELMQCGCGDDVKEFVAKCANCVNSQGCLPMPVDYERMCSDGNYPGELLGSFHSGLQCQKPGSRRTRRFVR